MSELTLKRSIMLDSGEIIPVGTVLKNYGDFTPKSIAPSLITGGNIQFKGKNKLAFKKAGEKNTIFFFRIPRECIDESTVSPDLKKLWVKGSDTIAPFFCSVKAKHTVETREVVEIREIEESNPHTFMGHWNYFDAQFNMIEVILISSLGELHIGSHYRLGNLQSVQKINDRSYADTCITYYYPDTSTIKIKTLQRNKFYVESPTYRIEKYFDELDKECVRCYERDNGNKFRQEFKVIDKGDNEWYKHFISTHSWFDDSNYIHVDNDYHIFGRYYYYDGKNVSGLTVLHKSTNPFRFFKREGWLKVLIKEHFELY